MPCGAPATSHPVHGCELAVWGHCFSFGPHLTDHAPLTSRKSQSGEEWDTGYPDVMTQWDQQGRPPGKCHYREFQKLKRYRFALFTQSWIKQFKIITMDIKTNTGHAIDWMLVFPPTFISGNRTPILWYYQEVGPLGGDQITRVDVSFPHVRTVRRPLSVNPEARPHQTLNLRVLQSWSSSRQNVSNKCVLWATQSMVVC